MRLLLLGGKLRYFNVITVIIYFVLIESLMNQSIVETIIIINNTRIISTCSENCVKWKWKYEVGKGLPHIPYNEKNLSQMYVPTYLITKEWFLNLIIYTIKKNQHPLKLGDCFAVSKGKKSKTVSGVMKFAAIKLLVISILEIKKNLIFCINHFKVITSVINTIIKREVFCFQNVGEVRCMK